MDDTSTLRALRLLSNRGLNETAKMLGMTPSDLSYVERGIFKPNRETSEKLSGFWGSPIFELLAPVADVLRSRERIKRVAATERAGAA